MKSFALRAGVVAAACVPFLASFASCSTSGTTPAADAGDPDADTRPPTPPEWDRAVTRTAETAAKASRASCTFKRGAMPAETLGSTLPIDKDIPIETIVVIMKENRSFDHYFGHLGKYANRTDIESAPETTTNPDKVGANPGATHAWQHAPHLCNSDTNHEWDGSHLEYDDGKNDGFVQANTKAAGEPGERAMWWFDERDIPFYYKLASTFAIADHYHCGILGPTWPNRMYLYAATSFGVTSNVFPNLPGYEFPTGKDASIFDELERRHVSWAIYSDGGPPGLGVVYGPAGAKRWGRTPNQGYTDFLAQAAAGTLPQVVFLDPHIGSEGPAQNDEHPPSDAQAGQKWTSDVVRALFKSPQWNHLALFLTWDEHGGYYDHVAPPSACAPDDTKPDLQGGETAPGGFDRLGFRVPLIVVSPYAKKGYVAHTTYDHTSITRFIETKFKLPALSGRDANADPLLDMFDFTTASFASPPDIAEPSIDPAELTYCTTTYKK